MLKLWLLTLFLCAGALVEANRGGQRVKFAEKEATAHDQVTAQEHDRKIAKATKEHKKTKEHVDHQKVEAHGLKVENYHRDTLKDDRKNEVLFQKDHAKKVEIKRDRKLRKTKLNVDDCSGGRSGSHSGSCSGSNESFRHRGCGCGGHGWPGGFGGGCGGGHGWPGSFGGGFGGGHGWPGSFGGGFGGGHGWPGSFGGGFGGGHGWPGGLGQNWWCDWCIKKLSYKYWNLFHKMCKKGSYKHTNPLNGDQCICSH